MKSGLNSIYKRSGFKSHRKDNGKYIGCTDGIFFVMLSTTSVQNFLISTGISRGKLKCFED